LVELLL